jgi:hypothetical protein
MNVLVREEAVVLMEAEGESEEGKQAPHTCFGA